MSSQVQSIVFPKGRWNLDRARAWLFRHGYKYGKVDKKPHTYRFRQLNPNPRNRYITKRLSNGVLLVLMFAKKKKKKTRARSCQHC